MAPVTRLQAKHAARAAQGPAQTRSKRRHTADNVGLARSPDRSVDNLATRINSFEAKTPEVKKPKVPRHPHYGIKSECCICFAEKSVPRNFKLVDDETTCEHFRNICARCVENMLYARIDVRKFEDADLACPFGECNHVLDMNKLRRMVGTKALIPYSEALMKHLLSSDPNFITCLNLKCGQYFSIEGCKPTNPKDKKTPVDKHKIACPYDECGHELCLACTRPWHPDRGCDQSKKREEEASETEIKSMGAKSCPKCGLSILKGGGCMHMTCRNCHHHFCFECLASYQPPEAHGPRCSNGGRIGIHMADFLPADLPVAQVQAIINQGHTQVPQLPQAPGPVNFQAWMQQAVNFLEDADDNVANDARVNAVHNATANAVNNAQPPTAPPRALGHNNARNARNNAANIPPVHLHAPHQGFLFQAVRAPQPPGPPHRRVPLSAALRQPATPVGQQVPAAQDPAPAPGLGPPFHPRAT